MYDVCITDLITWRNQILQAEVQSYAIRRGGRKNHQVPPFPEPRPHWWDATPLDEAPPVLTFAINAKAPLLDNYFTGTIFDLYSLRLVELIRSAGVSFEAFPVVVVDKKTGAEIGSKYNLFHLLEKHSVIDMHRSVYINHNIKKLYLTSKTDEDLTFFRDTNNADITLIHQSLKERFMSQGITGFQYVPIDKFETGGLYPAWRSS